MKTSLAGFAAEFLAGILWNGGLVCVEYPLFLKNNVTGELVHYDSVADYEFSPDGRVALVKTESVFKNEYAQVLLWVELPSCRATKIWEGENVNSYSFDFQSDKLAFVASKHVGSLEERSIYCYQKDSEKAENIVDGHSPEMGDSFEVGDDGLKFSRDGDKILFFAKKAIENRPIAKSEYVNVDIWNYKDEYLQSDQMRPNFISSVMDNRFIEVINILNRRIVQLNNEEEDVIIPPVFENYLLVSKSLQFKIYYKISHAYNLVSVNDGKRSFISDKNLNGYYLSPDDHYFVWFDYSSHQYFSLETATGVKRNISSSIRLPLDDTESINHENASLQYGIAGWQPNIHSVLIYDKFDIWKVDLLGNYAPINLTRGLGRRDSIVFDVIAQRYGGQFIENTNRIVSPNEDLLLSGFDLDSKNNGFWKMSNNSSIPSMKKLHMDSYFYVGRMTDGGDAPPGFVPLKAKYAKTYLVVKQTAREFPNLYVTSDFKAFHPVSHIHPEKKYNWLTSELITWKMTDGDLSQGVLYKPENFDQRKRYPVIFYFYVKQSNELNEYKYPEWCGGRLNIPYFVSNGYLVFMPDIHYKPGRNGQSIVNSVVSAAHYLAQLAYIDSNKMGIQGHSFGGWEIDYLVTHSHIFAAACATAGVSDQISNFNELTTGVPGLFPASYLEIHNPGDPYGAGVTPSTRPDVYEDNSPILAVENAIEPLLIVAGNLDGNVPFRQSLEMYLAMCRASKKVWLLQYEENGHILNGNDAKDYTMRLKQFFDYYLNGSMPPIWMTKGVPGSLKGIDTGLEIDSTGSQP